MHGASYAVIAFDDIQTINNKVIMNNKELMNKAADNIRILAASMVEKAKSGHPGGAMGGADFINVLFSEFLQYDPKNPAWVGRDRFFLDPGHMAPMLYAQLALIGKFSMEELQNLRQWGSPTTGHPEFEIARGILQDLYEAPVVDIYGIKAKSAYRIAAYGIEWDFDAIARDDDPPGKFAECVGNEVKAAVSKNPSAVAALREKLQDAVAAIDADTPTPSFEITVTGDYDSGMLTVTVSPKQV